MATTVDEFGNVVEVVTAEELIDQQNREFAASGGANDDSGDDIQSQAPTEEELQAWAKTPDYQFLPKSGTTQLGKSDTPAAKTSSNSPGRRLKNPLANFSSYTYQISLYMITPDAYAAFVASGRTQINAINTPSQGAVASSQVSENGAFLIAQSGGINNTESRRAPGFNLDYYIDDLKITSAINGKSTKTASNVTGISFNVIEPYGFSFITKLKNAASELAKVSKSKNFKDLTNPSRQFFVLGIRFQGYDQNGKVLTGQEHFAADTFNPSGNSSGIFERFYDITLTSMKFKIDGRATNYAITAVTTAPGAAFGLKRGIIDKGAKTVAKTVKEALIGNDPESGVIGILTKLNNDQKQLGVTPGLETTYGVKFLGDSADIQNATIVSKADLDKIKWPMNKAKTTGDSNAYLQETAVPNSDRRQLTFRTGTPILQAVELIIAQSSFLEQALTEVYTTDLEPDGDTDSNPEEKNKSPKKLRWYNISPDVKCKGFDPKTGDFAYDITFVIQPYETPIMVSAYAGKTIKYYGPHKRYDYWYTGKNSEIIHYEQTLDNSYFNVAVAQNDTKESKGQGGAAQSPVIPGKQQAQPDQGRSIGVSGEAQGSVLTSLFDPGSYAQAKIQILGDPDFLMQDAVSSSENLIYNQFYGTDGYTVNPNGGQVFIEIDFKEAIDYNNNKGIMDINDKILFWKYPKGTTVQGVSYMVITVVSTFSKGKFIQDLTCVINTFDGEAISTNASDPNGREKVTKSNAQSSAPTQSGNSTTSNKGFVPADEFGGLDAAVAEQAALNEAAASDAFYNPPNNEVTSPTRNGSEVVNDDASNSNYIRQFEESGRE